MSEARWRWVKVLAALAGSCTMAVIAAMAPARPSALVVHHPYPQQQSFPGCIKPSGPSQAELDADVWDYYRTWKQDYYRRVSWDETQGLIEGPPTGELPDGWPKGTHIISASEHTGYGLIIFALMAGKDPQAKACFDSLVRTCLNHPSAGNPAFMGWAIGDRPGLPRCYSATDGDFDIAYALYLAHLQWGGCPEGAPETYEELARTRVEAFIDSKRPGVINLETRFILLGDSFRGEGIVRDPGEESETVRGYFRSELSTRPSDWTLDHFPVFKRLVPRFPEEALRSKVFTLAWDASLFDPRTGLSPDFIITGQPPGGAGFVLRPAWRHFLDEPFETGEYHENAARMPWRLACDVAHTGDPRSRELARRLAAWISASIGTHWEKVVNGYQRCSGRPLPGAVGGPMAQQFVAPLVTACMVGPEFQAPLNAGWMYLRRRHVGSRRWKDDGYYKDTLTLLSLLQISGNWWSP